jgi:hypothetical protein
MRRRTAFLSNIGAVASRRNLRGVERVFEPVFGATTLLVSETDGGVRGISFLPCNFS